MTKSARMTESLPSARCKIAKTAAPVNRPALTGARERWAIRPGGWSVAANQLSHVTAMASERAVSPSPMTTRRSAAWW